MQLIMDALYAPLLNGVYPLPVDEKPRVERNLSFESGGLEILNKELRHDDRCVTRGM